MLARLLLSLSLFTGLPLIALAQTAHPRLEVEGQNPVSDCNVYMNLKTVNSKSEIEETSENVRVDIPWYLIDVQNFSGNTISEPMDVQTSFTKLKGYVVVTSAYAFRSSKGAHQVTYRMQLLPADFAQTNQRQEIIAGQADRYTSRPLTLQDFFSTGGERSNLSMIGRLPANTDGNVSVTFHLSCRLSQVSSR